MWGFFKATYVPGYFSLYNAITGEGKGKEPCNLSLFPLRYSVLKNAIYFKQLLNRYLTKKNQLTLNTLSQLFIISSITERKGRDK